MHTPITVFEAWLGMTIAEYETRQFEENFKEIERNFNWLSVSVELEDKHGDNIGDYTVSDDPHIKNLFGSVEALYSDMKEALENVYQERSDNIETYEGVFNEFFGYDFRKRNLGLQLCKYHDTQQELNENHFQMTKNDKANFETLILNFNK